MNEVGGDAAILVEPAKPGEAAGMIADALQDTARVRAAGLRNAVSYTTDGMLEKCEMLYRDVMNAG
jgi:hypothetical protein